MQQIKRHVAVANVIVIVFDTSRFPAMYKINTKAVKSMHESAKVFLIFSIIVISPQTELYSYDITFERCFQDYFLDALVYGYLLTILYIYYIIYT